MTRVIYKYTLKIEDRQQVRMPGGAKMLCVQNQGGVLCVWAMVDPEAQEDVRTFTIHGTGHECDPSGGEYLGTAQVGPLVWHVFVK